MRTSVFWGFSNLLVVGMLSAQSSLITAPTEAIEPPREVADAPTLTKQSLSMGEAVRLALLYDPHIQSAKQRVAIVLGQLQQASGLFDTSVRSSASFRYAKNELFPFLVNREYGKREMLRYVATAFEQVSRSLRKALAEEDLGPPDCPEGLEFVNISLLEGLDKIRRTGLSFSDALAGQAFVITDRSSGDRRTFVLEDDSVTGYVNDFFNVCVQTDSSRLDPNKVFNTLRRIGQVTGLNLEEAFTTLPQLPKEILTLSQQIAEAVADKADLAFRRQGSMPEDEATKTLSFGFGFSKPFRNGMSITSDLRLQSTERNFIKKPLDPAFGGMGIPHAFPSSFSVSLDVPIGKGRGTVSAQAPERAAELGLNAERDRLRHTISEEVFRTTLSYISLVAAQDSLSLIEESARRQQRLLELTEQLVEAGEIARVELNRSEARVASILGVVASTRLSVLSARIALANMMGIDVKVVAEAPIASDRFTDELNNSFDVDDLVRTAVSSRRDLLAAKHFKEASQVLANAARADLKRRLDFSVTGGISTLYESPFFRFFPDETDEADRPKDTPAHYYSPRGFWRGFPAKWEPFVLGAIRFEFPTANNVAKGRLLREESSLTISEIEFSNLDRMIRDNVIDLVGALEKAESTMARRRDAVKFYEQTLESALQRYRIGDLTLIDALTTEEELTQEKLSLLGDVQKYLSLLTRLRFEVGGLVSFQDEGVLQEYVEFETKGFVKS